jgi:hypothetical protein
VWVLLVYLYINLTVIAWYYDNAHSSTGKRTLYEEISKTVNMESIMYNGQLRINDLYLIFHLLP